MTSLQAAIFAALGQYAGLSALVGARIFPDIAPQDAGTPFVVWQEVSLQTPQDLNGFAISGGVDNYRIQITSWATTVRGATIARNVNDQVKAAMAAATGVKALLVDSRAMPYESDTRRHGMQSDFSVWLKT